MASRSRTILFNIVRFGVCAAALWFVVQEVTLDDHVVLKGQNGTLTGSVLDQGDHIMIRSADGQQRTVRKADIAVDEQGEPRITYGLKTAWSHSAPMLLLLALLIQFPVVFLQAVRLRWLLRAQRIDMAYWECLKVSFAGNFMNFAMPLGSNAGDVFKAYFVTTHTDRKTEAATTILLDRVIGLATLILCVSFIVLISGSVSRLAEFRLYILGALGLGIVSLLAYRSKMLRKHLVPRRWLESIRGGSILDQLRRIDRAAWELARYKTIVVAAVAITALLQGISICGYFTVASALSLDAHLGNMLEYFAYFYTGTVIQALPGPPQGLGTVELAYRYFLAPFGSPSQIICVAFAIRLTVLLASLPGLLVILTGSYKPHAVAPDPLPSNTGEPRPSSHVDPLKQRIPEHAG